MLSTVHQIIIVTASHHKCFSALPSISCQTIPLISSFHSCYFNLVSFFGCSALHFGFVSFSCADLIWWCSYWLNWTDGDVNVMLLLCCVMVVSSYSQFIIIIHTYLNCLVWTEISKYRGNEIEMPSHHMDMMQFSLVFFSIFLLEWDDFSVGRSVSLSVSFVLQSTVYCVSFSLLCQAHPLIYALTPFHASIRAVKTSWYNPLKLASDIFLIPLPHQRADN